MPKNFLTQLRNSLAHRRALPPAQHQWIVFGLVSFTLIYILLSMWMVPENAAKDFNFAEEEGSVTALSAIFLAMAGAFSWAAASLLARLKNRERWVWLVLALGFSFFALDELLGFHEYIGWGIDYKISTPLGLRNWNDVIVIVYGVIAIPILIAILPGLVQWKWVLESFILAFFFFILHTLVDSISEPPTYLSNVLEESAKLFCNAFLMFGAFLGLTGIFEKYSSGVPQNRP